MPRSPSNLYAKIGNAETVFWDGKNRRWRAASTSKALNHLATKLKNKRLYYFSVVPALSKLLKRRFKDSQKISPEDRGVRFAYSGLGEDRKWNLVAASFKTKKAFAVIDFGSAVTVDFVDRKRAHLGGWIWPGTRLMAESLHHGTAQLPLVRLKKRQLGLGKSTKEALEKAQLHALLAFRDYVVQYAKELLPSPVEIFLTGGDSRFLVVSKKFDPSLGLSGLRRVVEEKKL